jgi:hypothetical protein
MRLIPLKTLEVPPVLLPTDRARFAQAVEEAKKAGVEPPTLPEPAKFIYAERLYLIINEDFQRNGGTREQMLRVNRLQALLLRMMDCDADEMKLEEEDWGVMRAALERHHHTGYADAWVQFCEDMKDPPIFDPNAEIAGSE